MLVNKDHTLDVAGEKPYKPEQLFTPLQENSPAVQLSKSETIHLDYLYVTKPGRTLKLLRVTGITECLLCQMFNSHRIVMISIIIYRYVHIYSQQAHK